MGRYMRYLLMFGPMIYRAYTKWSNGRSKQQSVDQPRTQAHNENLPNQGEVNPKYKDKDVKYDGDEFV